jgi:small subunit ribosomal protein S8
MTTDPIADMLTRIRNAAAAGHAETSMPYSKIKEQIARILKERGFVADYSVSKDTPAILVVTLADISAPESITISLQRISKPGRRVYSAARDIPSVLGGRGFVIISTPSGMMTGSQARKLGLGGELICKVW